MYENIQTGFELPNNVSDAAAFHFCNESTKSTSGSHLTTSHLQTYINVHSPQR